MRIPKFLFPAILISVFGSVLYLVVERGALSMNQGVSASAVITSKPLIDSQVPKETATATFAMG